MASYTLAFQHATAHGVVAAFHIPTVADPVPDEVLARLHPDEAAFARDLRAFRQIQFVGGRLALREAARHVAGRLPAVLPDARGAPRLPEGIVGSVSHKNDVALAMVSRDRGAQVGVDVEDYAPERPQIERSVLTEAESAELEGLPADRRWIAVLLRFSIKESVYKAVDPYVHRYVGFHEAEVRPDLHGRAHVTLRLAGGEGPFEVDARYHWLHGRILTSVAIRPAPSGS